MVEVAEVVVEVVVCSTAELQEGQGMQQGPRSLWLEPVK